MAVVCSTAFFVHEFVEDSSQEYINAVDNYKKVKSKKVEALSAIKKNAEGTILFDKYKEASENEEIAWNEFKKAKSKESFLAFDNLQQFIGEFGWALGLLIYAIFNLILSFIRKNESLYGEVLLHGSLVLISCYFINWALFRFDDYDKIRYLTYSLLIASIIVFATNLLLKAKTKYMHHIEKSLRLVFNFLYKDAEEKQLINPAKKTDFKKTRLELTDKIVGNE